MLLSYATVDFHLFVDVAADMQICALHTRSRCRVSDTQVTVKALGPLVIFSRTSGHISTIPGRKRAKVNLSN